MTEYRLFDTDSPYVATAAFHAGRQRAPHLEQPMHQARLHRCAQLIRGLAPASVVDLGCGDGGLLSLLSDLDAWGYDFQPSNQQGWIQRGVTASLHDVFNARSVPRWGQCAVATEVLEHIADPHGALAWIARHATYLVASSPHIETYHNHGDCHAWAWDVPGYRALTDPHFAIMRHELVDWSQIIVGRSRYQ